ncbi:MAG: LamG-like jellyroll fold domain-containing protein, partial [Deltaproteobacteria bacterium]
GEGYTVSMWVRIEAANADYLLVHQAGDVDPTPVVVRMQMDRRFEHYVYWNAVPADSSTFSAAASTDDWHHVVALSEITDVDTRTSPARFTFTVRLFVDGVETFRRNEGPLWESRSTNWHLFGADSAVRDDLRIYRRPLSPSEVATLYAAERGVL